MLTDLNVKKIIEKNISDEQTLIRNEGDNQHNLLVMKSN